MNKSRWRLAALLCGIVVAMGAFAAPDTVHCAIADADRVLRETRASKEAQARLQAEFAPREAQLRDVSARRNAAEKAWMDALSAGAPADQVASLRAAYDQVRTDERKAYELLKKDLDARKQQELQRLVDRANEALKAMGRREHYARIYQRGEKDPAYDFAPADRAVPCGAQTDVTDALIAELDSAP